MSENSSNRTIAKNTLFLYIRMFIVVLVSLYTSRVILQVLGIDEYGLYQTVGGVVGFLAFISNALAGATSRFITFALGKGDKTELKNTFASTLTAHLFIGLFLVVVAETIGLWFVNNKMVIPADRFDAAIIVYHISIITSFLSIVLVPFDAEVIAHEKMSVFAYVGIVETLLKLLIVYLILISPFDKLVFYSILLMLVSFGVFFFYVSYSRMRFEEVRFQLFFDRRLFGNIFKFSGWSLFASGAIALSNQGIILLLNLFFPPAVVTARAISLQVNNIISQFVQNFRTAVNPQIVKRYASGDTDGSKSLLLDSTKYSYYLMLLISLPIIFLAEPLLNLWLVEVPDYTVLFLQIVIIQGLFQVFDASFYTALYAKGRITENALISPLVIYAVFPVVYLLFKNGASPLALSWAFLTGYAVLGMIIKPLLLNKIMDYKWKEIVDVYKSCFLVTISSLPVPLFIFYRIGVNTAVAGGIVLLVTIVSISLSIWFFGLTSSMKVKLIQLIKSRFIVTF